MAHSSPDESEHAGSAAEDFSGDQ